MTTRDHNEEVVEQFTLQAEEYRKLTSAMVSDRTAAVLELVGIRPDDVALDVACGPGSLALEIAPLVQSVIGADITPAMIEQAKIVQREKGIANVRWTVADLCDLPFEDAAFSLVLCRSAFHHFDRPAAAFAEMVRVCRPGGRIAVIDVTPAPDKAAGYDGIEKMRDPSHVHAHTLDELKALADGMPLGAPAIRQHVTANVPLDAVLAASFPTEHTNAQIAALFREDALSGEDRYGMKATYKGAGIVLSYPMTTVAWTRH